MIVLFRLCPFICLLSAVGCSGSTASWTEQTKAADPAKRQHAVHMLRDRANEGEAVVPVLIEALADEDTYVRRDAARALGQFGAEARDAIPPLLASLHDKEPSVRKASAQALKQIDPAAADEAGIR
jgi:HEAT repeat protein